jgi:tRNA G26 N,N-dimethylase Trm1
LSASGLRALRYAREIEGIGQVVALDNDPGALRVYEFTFTLSLNFIAIVLITIFFKELFSLL